MVSRARVAAHDLDLLAVGLLAQVVVRVAEKGLLSGARLKAPDVEAREPQTSPAGAADP